MRLQLSAQILKPSPASTSHTQTIPSHHHPIPTSKTSVLVKSNEKISRRNLAICTSSTLLFLNNLFQVSKAQAEEDPQSNERADVEEEDSQVSKVQAEEASQSNERVDVEEDLQVSKVQAEEDPQSNEIVNVEEDSQVSKVQAEDPQSNGRVNAEEVNSKAKRCTDISPTKQAFIDISINREPAGRIIIGLYGDDMPVGSSRFSNLVSGAAGISYRRKEFVKIMPNYVQHGGLRSYGVDAELAKKTGSKLAVDDLISEWKTLNERCPGTKNVAGSVSIIVRDPLKPPPKMKLMARNGKLVIDEEEVGIEPNGTEFVITTKDSPELDLSTLVIGKVLDGMEVLEKIAKVKTVQENSSSPYFRVAKLIGDKRAVVAERGFNRPYSKVIVTNCGLMD